MMKNHNNSAHNGMQQFLIYAENIERATFFASLVQQLSFLDIASSLFITDKYAVYRFLTAQKLPCVPINFSRKYKQKGLHPEQIAHYQLIVQRSINYKRNILNLRQGVTILAAAEQIISNRGVMPDCLFIFNGESFIDQWLVERFSHCQKLFFEVGNFPNRMIADPQGVNAKSSLYGQMITRNYAYQAFDYQKLILEKKKLPPQARLTISDKIMAWLLNCEGMILKGFPYTNFESPYCKLVLYGSAKRAKKWAIKAQTLNPEQLPYLGEYLFVPLQVASDTQLLYNSDVNNQELIEEALCQAAGQGCNVVVKYHPAERDYRQLKQLHQRFSQYPNLYFTSSMDTPTLIEHAKKIITINSNVGLEGILQHKPVQFVGRSVYQGFDFLAAVTYIQDYLLPLGYPHVQQLRPETIHSLYQRLLQTNA